MPTFSRFRAATSTLVAVLLSLPMVACTGSTSGGADGGMIVGSGLTYQDIGTVCTCDVVLTASGYSCSRNPTNTCPKSSLTCVINAPGFNNSGHPLFEYNLFTKETQVDGGVQIQGECTLVAQASQPIEVVPGTSPIQLSNGLKVLKRGCQSDTECTRPGWVCDAPLLDPDGINIANPAQEQPFNLGMCKPGCRADFPDCLRVTWCTLGKPGCYRSPTNTTGPAGMGIYVGDFLGMRSCNIDTGVCGATAVRTPLALPGNKCLSNGDCANGDLCISEYWWSTVPDGYGFCESVGCTPGATPAQAGGCAAGYTCRAAFEHYMCFPDCAGGTLCGLDAKCAALGVDPANGTSAGWTGNQCIPCDLAGSCP